MPWTEWTDPAFDAARALHARVGLIDLHVDSIIQNRLFGYDPRRRHRAGWPGQPLFWHADLPRMHDATYGGACLGIHYWPVEREGGWVECTKQIDVVDALGAADDTCLRVRCADDWDRAHETGRVALCPGVEGAHMLNGHISRVAELAARDVAYLTLAHFSKNAAATPSLGRGADETSGLSHFGREVVRACNAHGIAVDVAHVNTPGVLDACAASTAPVFCTHTGVKGVHDSARNITDEEIDAIAELDGAIGIILGPGFLTGSHRADHRCVVDHIEYVVDRVGWRHVSVGSDLDGWLPRIPNDMKDCRDLVKVTQSLLDRGHAEDDVALMLRANTMRVFRAVEAAAD